MYGDRVNSLCGPAGPNLHFDDPRFWLGVVLGYKACKGELGFTKFRSLVCRPLWKYCPIVLVVSDLKINHINHKWFIIWFTQQHLQCHGPLCVLPLLHCFLNRGLGRPSSWDKPTVPSLPWGTFSTKGTSNSCCDQTPNVLQWIGDDIRWWGWAMTLKQILQVTACPLKIPTTVTALKRRLKNR